MASDPRTEHAVFEACDRFFSIPELVDIFFEQASIPVLLTCQRVCRSWNERISNSKELRQSLFLEPVELSAQAEIKINPILASHFSPILAPAPSPYDDEETDEQEQLARLSRGQNSTSTHLALLPWARTGTGLASISRCAFSRREASWRNMLVSQPPIRRLDWWHEWALAASVSVDAETGDWKVHSGARGIGRALMHRGWGHQDCNNVNVTIGMLWDLVESRITRGCWARVMYFPHGKGIGGIDGDCDQLATRSERQWFRGRDSQKRGFSTELPRVKIQTTQVWAEAPRHAALRFDMEQQQWRAVTSGSRRRAFPGDGFNVLREDCSCEAWNGQRWSKSKAFGWAELDGESSGGS